MAIASFTFDEMVYNSIVHGKQIYYNGVLKTIDYVKLIKHTRQIQIICIPDQNNNVDVFLLNQDEVFDFEVNNLKEPKMPNLSKLKSKNNI